jgi:2-amino-4-hydroxy-6-hydroxymethyldihydropteridine diphosphokinase
MNNSWLEAVLSLGSNLGDRLLLLRESLHQLELDSGIEIIAVSSVYETDPVGYIDQPAFYNVVIKIMTEHSPEQLLTICQKIEKKFHRERKVRWGPRTIDIDILTYDDISIDKPDLTIPHPRMNEREFVMLPLQELITGQVQVSSAVRPIFSNWY